MSKHTSGQWEVKPMGEYLNIFTTGHPRNPNGHYSIASTSAQTKVTGESEANAKLIAAAPELLEALETLSKWVILNSDAIPSELIYAKVAIAKAKI